MFGSTVLAPLLMGFDPNVAILMSGIGTLIFFLFGRAGAELPGVQFRLHRRRHRRHRLWAAPTPISAWRCAIIACGLYPDRPDRLGRQCARRRRGGLIDTLMPPVVTGAVVAVIGLNLAPIAAKGAMGQSGFDTAMALVTVPVRGRHRRVHRAAWRSGC